MDPRISLRTLATEDIPDVSHSEEELQRRAVAEICRQHDEAVAQIRMMDAKRRAEEEKAEAAQSSGQVWTGTDPLIMAGIGWQQAGHDRMRAEEEAEVAQESAGPPAGSESKVESLEAPATAVSTTVAAAGKKRAPVDSEEDEDLAQTHSSKRSRIEPGSLEPFLLKIPSTGELIKVMREDKGPTVRISKAWFDQMQREIKAVVAKGKRFGTHAVINQAYHFLKSQGLVPVKTAVPIPREQLTAASVRSKKEEHALKHNRHEYARRARKQNVVDLLETISTALDKTVLPEPARSVPASSLATETGAPVSGGSRLEMTASQQPPPGIYSPGRRK